MYCMFMYMYMNVYVHVHVHACAVHVQPHNILRQGYYVQYVLIELTINASIGIVKIFKKCFNSEILIRIVNIKSTCNMIRTISCSQG